MAYLIPSDDQEQGPVYSLDDACRRLLLDRHFIVSCVEYDVAEVRGTNPAEWTFTSWTLLRIQKAYRLHRDLDIHPASLGLILELLDEREALREEVGMLRRRLSHWELP